MEAFLKMQLVSRSCDDTIKIGRRLAGGLRQGDIICLFGELGSGKTVLTQGIAEGIGFKRHQISSPTFVIIRQHEQGKLPLYHFDLYRLRSSEDIQALGYEEYFFGEGVSVVEWPDRLGCLLPNEYLRIEIEVISENSRRFCLHPFGSRYEQLIKEIR
jgi:tRNA threonylcarbamoyladenosine biosynthesis protein TsaE